MSGSQSAPRRVLVTGASGNIGAAVTAELAARGVRVTGLAIDGEAPPGADRFVRADATDAAAIRDALEGADAVVHLAAIPHPSIDTPYAVFRTNVVSTFAVLSQAGELGIRRAVIASSINASGIPFNPHHPLPAYYPIDEELPADLGDAYSLSKSVDETSARMAHRTWGIDVVAFRFPLVKDRSSLLHAARDSAADPSRTVREGWAYLDVRDGARAVRLALEADVHGVEVLLLSADDTLLDEDTAAALARYAPGVPLRTPLPGRTAAVDDSRARALLGFRPEFSIHRAEAIVA
jgi:nucleoside-diphosphate-sugar epimerase